VVWRLLQFPQWPEIDPSKQDIEGSEEMSDDRYIMEGKGASDPDPSEISTQHFHSSVIEIF
jgi:hypothetical protein